MKGSASLIAAQSGSATGAVMLTTPPWPRSPTSARASWPPLLPTRRSPWMSALLKGGEIEPCGGEVPLGGRRGRRGEHLGGEGEARGEGLRVLRGRGDDRHRTALPGGREHDLERVGRGVARDDGRDESAEAHTGGLGDARTAER